MTIYPTYLYIKQHSVTGLKYFGKTTKDPLKYNGSGKRWLRHLKKHGTEHVISIWVSEPYIDSDAITEFALTFSIENNIVESKDWANLIQENGLDGNIRGSTRSDKTKQKLKEAWKTRPPQTEETKKKKAEGSRNQSADSRKKQGDKIRGRKQSVEHVKKRTGGQKGRTHSTESKQKMSGPRGPNITKGIPKGPQPKVECPHCGLVGGSSNMTRHHFDNCKMKPI
jgi:hypothetical protein